MKDLKHYFNSPTESDKTNDKSSQIVQSLKDKSVDTKEPASKKRKISLKNNKVKADSIVLSKTENNSENQLESSLDEVFEPISKNKKRKRQSNKKPKLKKSKDLQKSAEDNSERDIKNDAQISNNDIVKDDKLSIKHDSLQSENSNSCDEKIVIPKTKRKSRILEESDEEVSVVNKPAVKVEDKTTNEDKNAANPPKSSLFGYFNKVDKETALKQQSSKIKVEAIVHVPEPGTKVTRKSLEKFTPVSKQTKRKNKLLLENSDTIEVISSEEIDENSCNSANVQMSPKPQENLETGTSVNDSAINTESKVKNLASIFVQKKKDKAVSPKENNSPIVSENNESEKDTTVKKGKKKGSLKLIKTSKDKSSPSSQSKTGSTKNEDASKRESKTPISSNPATNDKGKTVVDSPTSQKLSCPPNKSNNTNSSKTEIQKESPKNETMNITPDRVKETSKEQKHSTSKCKTLNGYFTPKNANKDCEESEESSSSKCSPGWVMKVRFGASRPLPDSDEDSLSQDSKKGNPPTAKTSNNQAEEENKNRLDVECESESTTDAMIVGDNADSSSSKAVPCKKNEMSAVKDCIVSSEKRPRRSCTRKKPTIVKDDDNEDSSSSVEATSKKKQKCYRKELVFSKEKRPKRAYSEQNTAVIAIDDDSSEVEENSSKRKSTLKNVKKSTPSPATSKKEVAESPKTPATVKMWPFFNKAAQKTKETPVDEAKLKAKQLFLESGIPEVIKRKVESVKHEVVLGNPAPFPWVSHVTQAEVESLAAVLRLPPTRPASPPPSLPAWSQLVCTAEMEESEIPVFQRPANIKTTIHQLKEEEPKTDVKVMYKSLKEYKSRAESDIWTEVYKPNKAADMVGNSESLKKLKSWLEALKNRRKREGSESSGDEFITEEDSNEDSSYNNMAVISGPCGCGKTSAVYAVANELDCKVLEINASCNRAGKKILAEFSESTQSHQVERSQINGLFNNQHAGKSRKRKKSKLNEPKSEKTSLILVEDADLLFTDVDEGFMSSLSSLAATTKRPLILVTNQTHNPHLERFHNSRLLQLTFNRPKPGKLALWLRLVGLVEGVDMTSTEADRLVTWAKCDVRKCLLQLQLMVHSNNSEIKESMSGGDLWWHWPAKHRLSFELPCLLEPEPEAEATTQDKPSVMRQMHSVAQTSSQLAYLDLLSTYSHKSDCTDDEPCPVAWRTVCQDSTALTECEYRQSYDTTHELTTWLTQTVAVETSLRKGPTSSEARWQSILRQGEQFYLAGVSTTSHTNHRTVTCDYLPALRELGRAEKLRLVNYTRRANRFFHYLQGLNIHASQSYRDFMSGAFS